ncbi:MAG: hypothetical protein ABIW79_10195 [Gemmatimonas sp.]
MTRARLLALLFVSALQVGCRKDDTSLRASGTSADSQSAHIAQVVASGGVVDSILPVDESLRRFRATIPEHPDTLRGASASLNALLSRLASAVSQRDSAALNAMVFDRAEFAWLYYSESAMSRPPYEAPPGLLWTGILASSDEGVKQLLSRFGGKPLRLHGVSCSPPRAEGGNTVHERCEVRASVAGKSIGAIRLFGTVIERDGRFKFLGYTNAL